MPSYKAISLSRFLSTLSLRRATQSRKISPRSLMLFLSTLSLRRATTFPVLLPLVRPYFYPRSPCGERLFNTLQIIVDGYFYPRSPCGERLTAPIMLIARANFYPRSPCGERRVCIRCHKFAHLDFYPRSPCGERPCHHYSLLRCHHISIHALLAESDVALYTSARMSGISIHALLAESDHSGGPLQAGYTDFYPRSPCGERPGVSTTFRA